MMIEIDINSLISTSVTSTDPEIGFGDQKDVEVDDDGFTKSNVKGSLWDNLW